MTRSTLSPLAILLAAACALLAGCTSNLTYLDVPLKYNPTDNAPAGLTLPASKVYVATIADNRENTSEIGENREEEKARPIYAIDPQPPEFVRRVLINELRNDGVNVVDSPGDADRIINISLQRFWVTEMDQYEGIVTLVGQVTDKSGKVLADGVIGRGDDSTFGHSMSPENYQEVLSNSTDQAIHHILGNVDFVRALSTGNGG